MYHEHRLSLQSASSGPPKNKHCLPPGALHEAPQAAAWYVISAHRARYLELLAEGKTPQRQLSNVSDIRAAPRRALAVGSRPPASRVGRRWLRRARPARPACSAARPAAPARRGRCELGSAQDLCRKQPMWRSSMHCDVASNVHIALRASDYHTPAPRVAGLRKHEAHLHDRHALGVPAIVLGVLPPCRAQGASRALLECLRGGHYAGQQPVQAIQQ